jgi:hypothetical protein
MLREAIIIVVILLILYVGYKLVEFGPYNTTSVAGCSDCEAYQVHRAHNDQKAAAALLEEINSRNETLIGFLEKKYATPGTSTTFNPDRANKIDVIPESEMYTAGLGPDVTSFIRNKINREYIQERVAQLVRNYSPDRMYEISPRNAGNATSYTEDKKILVLCLRRKTPDAKGHYELHDIDTMMFVVLHELSHMMNDKWEHGVDFWVLFKFMLLNGVEAGIYAPVDYGKKPIVYCGLELKYNPLFDPAI